MTRSFLSALFILAPVLVPGALSACSVAEIDSLQNEMKITYSTLEKMEVDLETKSTALNDLALKIEKDRANINNRSNPIKRFRLENLLRKFRALSDDMNNLHREKAAVETGASVQKNRMQICLRLMLKKGWQNLFVLLKEGSFDKARSAMEDLGQLESKLKQIDRKRREMEYPVFSETMLADYMNSEEDGFLFKDMVLDMMDKASRDSAALAENLDEMKGIIKQKSDLLSLLDEAEEAGVQGGSFFGDFDKEELAFEINVLKKDASGIEDGLKKAEEAIAYYRKYVFFMEHRNNGETLNE